MREVFAVLRALRRRNPALSGPYQDVTTFVLVFGRRTP
jgi:hypothetical protein